MIQNDIILKKAIKLVVYRMVKAKTNLVRWCSWCGSWWACHHMYTKVLCKGRLCLDNSEDWQRGMLHHAKLHGMIMEWFLLNNDQWCNLSLMVADIKPHPLWCTVSYYTHSSGTTTIYIASNINECLVVGGRIMYLIHYLLKLNYSIYDLFKDLCDVIGLTISKSQVCDQRSNVCSIQIIATIV